MVKFKDVYDPQKGEPINYKEAIKEIRKGNRDRYDYWCPSCQDIRVQLTVVNPEGKNPHFRLMPKREHFESCSYKLSPKELKRHSKIIREYLAEPTNSKSFLQELKRKLNNMLNPNNNDLSSSIPKNNDNVSLQSSGSQVSEKERIIRKPHQYEINARSIYTIRAMAQQGFTSKNLLPIGLYGKAIVEAGHAGKEYKDYIIRDQEKKYFFSLGLPVQKFGDLILDLDRAIRNNKLIAIYGIFRFYSKKENGTVYTNAYVNRHEILLAE